LHSRWPLWRVTSESGANRTQSVMEGLPAIRPEWPGGFV
jgi:hypothetical protein